MKGLKEFIRPLDTPIVISKDLTPCRFRLIISDSRDMFEIPSESIGLIVTSPPYFNVKEYSNLEQDIGNVNDYQQYLEDMKLVFEECYRVLKQGRYFALNISDIVSDGVKYPIPFDYVRICREIGFVYIDDIIWKKPSACASSNRFGVFIENPYPLYYYPNNIYEHIIILRKGGSNQEKKDSMVSSYDYNTLGTDIWEINPETVVEHQAPFPVELPNRIIMLYSYIGDIVLDPFLGSGTTMLACRILRRSCVGYELNPDFEEIITNRVKFNQSSMSGDVFDIVVNRVEQILYNCPKCNDNGIADVEEEQVNFLCLSCGYSESNKKRVFG